MLALPSLRGGGGNGDEAVAPCRHAGEKEERVRRLRIRGAVAD